MKGSELMKKQTRRIQRVLAPMAMVAMAFFVAPALAQASAPTIVESSASWITSNTADLDGGFYTDENYGVYVEYGKTNSYGTKSRTWYGNGSKSLTHFGENVETFEGGTVYHFRVVVSNKSGTAYGPDTTFETSPGPYWYLNGEALWEGELEPEVSLAGPITLKSKSYPSMTTTCNLAASGTLTNDASRGKGDFTSAELSCPTVSGCSKSTISGSGFPWKIVPMETWNDGWVKRARINGFSVVLDCWIGGSHQEFTISGSPMANVHQNWAFTEPMSLEFDNAPETLSSELGPWSLGGEATLEPTEGGYLAF